METDKQCILLKLRLPRTLRHSRDKRYSILTDRQRGRGTGGYPPNETNVHMWCLKRQSRIWQAQDVVQCRTRILRTLHHGENHTCRDRFLQLSWAGRRVGPVLCGLILTTLQRQYTENLRQLFPEMKLRVLIPNSYIHVSVRDLYTVLSSPDRSAYSAARK